MMHDRLRTLKFARNMRNIFICLTAVLLLEAGFLIFSIIVSGQRFFVPASIFLVLAVLAGYLAFYFHGRFRCRE